MGNERFIVPKKREKAFGFSKRTSVAYFLGGIELFFIVLEKRKKLFF